MRTKLFSFVHLNFHIDTILYKVNTQFGYGFYYFGKLYNYSFTTIADSSLLTSLIISLSITWV